MATRVRFEDLIGKPVLNPRGRIIGRIEEARIEPDGDEYVITHFLIGRAERLARLRVFLGELPTLRTLRLGKARDVRPFPWHWFDWSDPDRPRLIEHPGDA